MFAIGNDELEQLPTLPDEPFVCHRCGEPHPILDSNPPGKLQAVRCGDDLFMVGLNWKRIQPPKERK